MNVAEAQELAGWVREQLDDEERLLRAASGATVVGEPGMWRRAPGCDEWEASESSAGDKELLVALRPGLPRPPKVMDGYWAAVFQHEEDPADSGETPMAAFEHAARWDPARALRVIQSDRQVLADCLRVFADEGGTWIGELPEMIIRQIAVRRRERPGYRDEWLPSAGYSFRDGN